MTEEAKRVNRLLITFASLLAVVLVGMTYTYVATPTLSAAEHNALAREYLTGENYNIDQAITHYEAAVAADPQNKEALYALARGYYISQDYDAAFRAIAAYRDQYPDDARIDYVAGLANAYAGHLDASAAAFNTFIDSGLATWPTYLDLAWVYFKQGEFAQAQEQLEYAEESFGSNAWLSTSLGAVHVAQGESEAAENALENALDQIDKLTYEDWRANYTMNNPAEVEKEIAQMRSVAEFNLALARGEADAVSQEEIISLVGVPFADNSVTGINSGFVVSACGNACTTTQCISGANICGDVNVGTQSSCGGGCSAAVPANPSGTCSVPTVCGVNATGFNGCNGQCNITQYPFCKSVENPDGDGEIEWITLDPVDGGTLGATDIVAEIFAVPSLVNPAGTTVVRWLSVETDTCEVTSSSNGDVWSGIFGEELSSPILEQTTYTLTCTGFDGSTVTDTAVVEIVPAWEEF